MDSIDIINIKDIEKLLFKSNATAYDIEKVAKVNQSSTNKFRKNKRDYLNMTLKTARQYQAYYNTLKEKE